MTETSIQKEIKNYYAEPDADINQVITGFLSPKEEDSIMGRPSLNNQIEPHQSSQMAVDSNHT